MGQAFRRQCGCGADGRWKAKPPPQIFAGDEEEPTRTCLPQVDPLHKERVECRRRAIDAYNAAVMARKRSEDGAPQALPSGWPIALPSPIPPQEVYDEFWHDRFNWEGRLGFLLDQCLGPEAQELLDSWGGSGKEHWGSFEEMEGFFRSSRRPRALRRPRLWSAPRDWRDDAEFVRARVSGAHPSAIAQVVLSSRPLAERLPDGLQVDLVEEAVEGRLDDCKCLSEAVAQGRLYAVDHGPALRELVAYGRQGWEWEYARGLDRKQATLCNPVALFFKRLPPRREVELTADGGGFGLQVDGATITAVGAAAEASGLRKGMIVHRVGARFCRTERDVADALRDAGSAATVSVYEGQGELVPLCIQLYSKPSHPGHATLAPRNPVYTPWDPPMAWLMAKMFFNQADLHVHLIGTLHTQGVLVPSLLHSIAWRNFSPHHPLRQLLRPHLRGTIGWAERWGSTLLGGEAGLLLRWLAVDLERYQDLSTRAYMKFDFINNSVKHDWRQRMESLDDIPEYHYRDDALAIWEAVEEYVMAVVQRYYTKHDDIDHDVELKGWIREMSTWLTRVMEVNPARPWDPIVFNITNVITLCSVTPSAHLGEVYDWYGCVPFFPANASAPPCVHKDKDQITEADLLQMMPDKQSTLLQIASCHLLSELTEPPASEGEEGNPVTLPRCGAGFGDFGKRELFIDRGANRLAEALRKKLEEVSARIRERNAAIPVPYEALLPSRVRNGISAIS